MRRRGFGLPLSREGQIFQGLGPVPGWFRDRPCCTGRHSELEQTEFLTLRRDKLKIKYGA